VLSNLNSETSYAFPRVLPTKWDTIKTFDNFSKNNHNLKLFPFLISRRSFDMFDFWAKFSSDFGGSPFIKFRSESQSLIVDYGNDPGEMNSYQVRVIM